MIPANVVITLARTGTVQKSDFVGKENFGLANGSIVPSTEWRGSDRHSVRRANLRRRGAGAHFGPGLCLNAKSAPQSAV
jgi:hypothetical protein